MSGIEIDQIIEKMSNADAIRMARENQLHILLPMQVIDRLNFDVIHEEVSAAVKEAIHRSVLAGLSRNTFERP